MRVVVLADTHVRVGGRRQLPRRVWAELDLADAILHAGDVLEGALLDQLASIAPLHAVLGNNDHGLQGRLPERLEVELEGLRVGLVHDSGTRAGRPARLARWFPEADVVLFGHSHQPVDEHGVGDQRLFNPGSPTDPRGQPHPTFGVWDIDAGALTARIVQLV